MQTAATPIESSHLTPSFGQARVRDALRSPLVTCPPDTPMNTVAELM